MLDPITIFTQLLDAVPLPYQRRDDGKAVTCGLCINGQSFDYMVT
jgi:hypothetical protein